MAVATSTPAALFPFSGSLVISCPYVGTGVPGFHLHFLSRVSDCCSLVLFPLLIPIQHKCNFFCPGSDPSSCFSTAGGLLNLVDAPLLVQTGFHVSRGWGCQRRRHLLLLHPCCIDAFIFRQNPTTTSAAYYPHHTSSILF